AHRASQPLGAQALPRRQRDPSRPVGQLLRHLGDPRRRPGARGPRLMLATLLETVDGHRVRVARLGAGPPLGLLHGYPENLPIWCELGRRLAERFAVTAFDWSGMGVSAPSPGGNTPSHSAARVVGRV